MAFPNGIRGSQQSAPCPGTVQSDEFQSAALLLATIASVALRSGCMDACCRPSLDGRSTTTPFLGTRSGPWPNVLSIQIFCFSPASIFRLPVVSLLKAPSPSSHRLSISLFSSSPSYSPFHSFCSSCKGSTSDFPLPLEIRCSARWNPPCLARFLIVVIFNLGRSSLPDRLVSSSKSIGVLCIV